MKGKLMETRNIQCQVEVGVDESRRLESAYERRRRELDEQWQAVRQEWKRERQQALDSIRKAFGESVRQLDAEYCAIAPCSPTPSATPATE